MKTPCCYQAIVYSSATLLAAGALALAQITVHTGSLARGDDDLVIAGPGQQGWQRTFDGVEWRVEHRPGEGPFGGHDWFYSYTFATRSWGVTNFALQTSAGVRTDDFVGLAATVSSARALNEPLPLQIGQFDGTSLNGLPAPLNGLALLGFASGGSNNAADTTTVSFWSKHEPTLGHFFISGGGGNNRAWNSAFGDSSEMFAPMAATEISVGMSLNGYVLVPIPEARTHALVFGLIFLVVFIWRRVRRTC